MFDELRERVVAANLALVDAGLVVLTFGNASAADRAAGVMAIKPSGVSYDRLTVADVTVVDLASGAVVDGETQPSSDTPTHLALYRAFARSEASCTRIRRSRRRGRRLCASCPASARRTPTTSTAPVPVTRQLTAAEIEGDYEERTGAVIVETFAERGLDPLELPAALVASHGPFVWGAEVEDAVENAVALEAVAASAYRSFQLAAGIEAIPPELLEKHFSRKHGAGAYYGQPA